MEDLLKQILANQELIMKKLGIKKRKYSPEQLNKIVKQIRKEK